jgi:hypothetical protein
MNILTDNQNTAYNEFYESTHNNEFLDSKQKYLLACPLPFP